MNVREAIQSDLDKAKAEVARLEALLVSAQPFLQHEVAVFETAVRAFWAHLTGKSTPAAPTPPAA